MKLFRVVVVMVLLISVAAVVLPATGGLSYGLWSPPVAYPKWTQYNATFSSNLDMYNKMVAKYPSYSAASNLDKAMTAARFIHDIVLSCDSTWPANGPDVCPNDHFSNAAYVNANRYTQGTCGDYCCGTSMSLMMWLNYLGFTTYRWNIGWDPDGMSHSMTLVKVPVGGSNKIIMLDAYFNEYFGWAANGTPVSIFTLRDGVNAGDYTAFALFKLSDGEDDIMQILDESYLYWQNGTVTPKMTRTSMGYVYGDGGFSLYRCNNFDTASLTSIDYFADAINTIIGAGTPDIKLYTVDNVNGGIQFLNGTYTSTDSIRGLEA